MKKFLRQICPNSIHSCYVRIKFWLRFHLHPQGIANDFHKALVGYDIDWKNPQTLNEKINWMKFNCDTIQWSRLADKYLVREYVKERIGEEKLPKLYAVWDCANKIDFNKLPNKFILKTNHACHTVMPILDKETVNVLDIKKQFSEWMKKQYGYDTAEPHYLRIKPLIIAEELLDNDATFSTTLADYKVYCFDGKPFCILVCTDRNGAASTFSYFDCNWNPLHNVLNEKLKGLDIDVPKPDCLSQLLNDASILAKGHPQVRVDFYITHGKIYFGEMTFTSEGGYDGDVTKEFCLQMGKQFTLPKKKELCYTRQ